MVLTQNVFSLVYQVCLRTKGVLAILTELLVDDPLQSSGQIFPNADACCRVDKYINGEDDTPVCID